MTDTPLAPRFAEVAVDGPMLYDSLTYGVPDGLTLRAGDVVWLPLRNKRTLGVVLRLTDSVPPALAPKIRPLVGRVETDELDLDLRAEGTDVDAPPVVAPHLLALSRWMSGYYMARPYECAALALPPGLARPAIETLVALGVAPDTLPPNQATLLEAITGHSRALHDFAYDQADLARALAMLPRSEEQSAPDAAELDAVRDAFGVVGFNAALDALEKKGLVRRISFAPAPALRPKYRSRLRLAPAYASATELTALIDAQKRATRRARALSSIGHAAHILDGTDSQKSQVDTEDWLEADTLADADPATLKALADKGYIEIEERQILREPEAVRPATSATERPNVQIAPQLTYQQSTAWRAIYDSMGKPGAEAFLLHGVTGSGKTELYLRATRQALLMGKQAIILVPEIALTEQTIRRFVARFPGRVAVRHSELTVGEAFDQWRRIRAGQADIVIGARSALFSPLPRLGLIIIDEEHEPAYKQDTPPRYHARETALKLAELTGAKVILGSATPSLEIFHKAVPYRERNSPHTSLAGLPPQPFPHRNEGREQESFSDPPPSSAGEGLGVGASSLLPDVPVRLLTLTERIAPAPQAADEAARAFNDAVPVPLPRVEVIDLREELKSGNNSIFSRDLIKALRATLRAGKQAILFLNRRGNATCVMCRDCGAVMVCRRCGAPLIYHSRVEGEGDLSCHRCGNHYPTPEVCPKCGHKRIRYFGIGTQKVEEAVARLLPDARLMRWDADSIRAAGRGGYADFFHRFANHEADVLIGTQMIAKGLDLPDVTLVGVVMADTGLYLPDVRAAERTFQLLTQVAGRAGRRGEGTVIVQSYAPDNYAIATAAHHDYATFYKQELAFRRGAHYPPFSQLIRMVLTATNQRTARIVSADVAANLRLELAARGLLEDDTHRNTLPAHADLIGPAPTFFERVRGSYRWHLLIRVQTDPFATPDEQADVGAAVRAAIRALRLGAEWAIDVDPVAML